MDWYWLSFTQFGIMLWKALIPCRLYHSVHSLGLTSDLSQVFHTDDTFTFWMYISEIIRAKMMIFDYDCLDSHYGIKCMPLGYEYQIYTIAKSADSRPMYYARMFHPVPDLINIALPLYLVVEEISKLGFLSLLQPRSIDYITTIN